jgi:hypothetical protein
MWCEAVSVKVCHLYAPTFLCYTKFYHTSKDFDSGILAIFSEMGVCSSSGGMVGRNPNVVGPFVKAGLYHSPMIGLLHEDKHIPGF